MNLRAIPAPDQIDKKFTQQGWSLDPHLCPGCRAKAAREKSMTANPSSAAIKAQAKMFTLLASHFDGDTGAYAEGWSDKKIATDTSLSTETVAAFRAEAFGDLKEPAEIRVLREDIAAARSLLDESTRTMRADLDALTRRLVDLSKRWAA